MAKGNGNYFDMKKTTNRYLLKNVWAAVAYSHVTYQIFPNVILMAQHVILATGRKKVRIHVIPFSSPSLFFSYYFFCNKPYLEMHFQKNSFCKYFLFFKNSSTSLIYTLSKWAHPIWVGLQFLCLDKKSSHMCWEYCFIFMILKYYSINEIGTCAWCMWLIVEKLKKKVFAIKDKNKKDIVLHYKKHAFVAY